MRHSSLSAGFRTEVSVDICRCSHRPPYMFVDLLRDSHRPHLDVRRYPLICCTEPGPINPIQPDTTQPGQRHAWRHYPYHASSRLAGNTGASSHPTQANPPNQALSPPPGVAGGTANPPEATCAHGKDVHRYSCRPPPMFVDLCTGTHRCS